MSIVCRPPTAEYSTSRSARTVSGMTGGAGVWPAITPEAASKRIERRECIDATILQTIGFIRVHSWPDLSDPDFAKTHTQAISDSGKFPRPTCVQALIQPEGLSRVSGYTEYFKR